MCGGLPCTQALFQTPSELPSDGAVLPWGWGQALKGTCPLRAGELRPECLQASCRSHELGLEFGTSYEMYVVIRIIYLVLFSV